MAKNIQEQLNRIVERKSRVTHLDNLIQGYRLYARTEGKSPKTITITTTAVTTLRDFLESKAFSTDVADIGIQELREFILYLQQVKAYQHHPYTKPQDRQLSGHAINCYLRAIRAFWSWLMREEIILSNPFIKLRIPKPPKKVIPTFSESQIQALLGVIRTSTPIGFRDWTMVLTLLDTGLRASELVGFTLNNVNLDDGLVKLCGKGAKERIVPIGARVQRAMWKYIHRYRTQPSNPLCDNLFLTSIGEPITVNRLETIIESYGRKAGLEGIRCSPHTFRHTFAISYLRNGGDVFSLQQILGHSSLDVVRVYVNLAEADVKACHRRFSPADNMELRRS
ncbi:MAG TPA: tyrosine-type recombinase/integrase [Dehalococcoidia bacterium]|nr:tyrosine-type recombinase/integrase [Dehalococcoidia bacterium]